MALAGQGSEPPLERLLALLAEYTAHAGSLGRTADAGALTAAARTAGQVVRHPGLQTLPPDARSSVLQLAGHVFHWRYLDLHEPEDLTAWAESMAQAVAATPTGDHHRQQRLILLAQARLQQYRDDAEPTGLRSAFATFDQALAVSAAEPELAGWACMLGNDLAFTLHQRHQKSAAPGDLRLAIETYDRVMSSASIDDPEWARAVTGYGDCLHDRYLLEGEDADLQLAVAAFERAVAATPADDPALWTRLTLWGVGSLDRYERGGELVDLDQAIDAFERSAAATPEGHPALAQAVSNLGGALIRRYERTGELVDLPPAVDTLRRAVDLTPDGHSDLAPRLNNFGGGLLHLFDRTKRQVELDSALEAFRRAVRSTPLGDAALPLRLCNLGDTLVRRNSVSQDPNDLDEAVVTLRQAASATPDHATHLVITLRALGLALSTRFTRYGAAEDGEEATETLRRACTAGLVMAPGAALDAADIWSRWAAAREEWPEVSEAGEGGLAALDALVDRQLTRGHKETVLRTRAGLVARTAYARAIMTPSDGEGAVVALERGRAVLLAEAMRRGGGSAENPVTADHADLAERYRQASDEVRELEREAEQPGATASLAWAAGRRAAGGRLREAVAAIQAVTEDPDLLGPPTMAGILHTAGSAPLVYVAAAEPGGMACLVRQHAPVTTIVLPGLDSETLRCRVNQYRTAYLRRRENPVAWRTCLIDVTGWLWEAVMGPLLDILADTSHVVLIPTGLLGLLPLHAAWVPDPVSPTRRRYALDQVLITYAPSAHALRRTQLVADSVVVDRLLAVDEPRPVAAPALPYSAMEVQAAVDFFPVARVLRHEQATRDAVLEGLSQYPVVHLSGHAYSFDDTPLDSGLVTAGYGQLTLREVMGSRVAVRLVVLSACETAVTGAENPDEVISLPTGLLQAGAAGVVGSLWSVPSLSTAVLVARFYRHWRTTGVEPAEALRQAQRWVRDATYADLAEEFPAVEEFTRAAVPTWRPFAEPYSWAAFAYTGS